MSQDFHVGQVEERIAVPLPAHEAFDCVAFLHARAFTQPVIGLGANPVADADAAGPSTHEQRCADRSTDSRSTNEHPSANQRSLWCNPDNAVPLRALKVLPQRLQL